MFRGHSYPVCSWTVLFAGGQSEAQATPVAQPEATVTATTIASKKPQATPAVRRIASEHNVSRSFVILRVLWETCAIRNITS